jgi:hypothetical protein
LRRKPTVGRVVCHQELNQDTVLAAALPQERCHTGEQLRPTVPDSRDDDQVERIPLGNASIVRPAIEADAQQRSRSLVQSFSTPLRP